MNDNRHLRARANVVYLLVVLFALAIAAKLFTIQFLEGEKWVAKAQHVSTAWRTVQPDRGNIHSADGRLLATSVPIYEVRMDLVPEGLTDEIFFARIDSLALCLSGLFGDRSAAEYKRDLVDARGKRKRYHLIRRGVDHSAAQRLRTFPIFDRKGYSGGLILEKRTERNRPFGRLAERSVGKWRDDSTRFGLEAGFDATLRGTTGRRLERRLAGGVWMPVGDADAVDPKPGADIHTTIDMNLQDVADAALEAQLRKHGAQYGCVVVMEVATGYVKAVSNLTRVGDSSYVEKINYAVEVRTEPGSTFKLPALMVGLEDGLISPEDSVDTKGGRVPFFDRVMKDSHEGGHGRITVRRAFELSSNTGISQVVYNAYGQQPKRFVEGLRRMGLGEPLGLDIPGEVTPTLRQPGDQGWSAVSIPWMSIGYETAFTPLQLLAFYNAVANDGRMMKPQFVDRVTRNGRTVQELKPQVLHERICSKRTLEAVRSMLEGVVEQGTATNLRGAHFDIAGKTGTAQILRDGSYKQHGVSYQASFAGYFPADAPKYSCIVVVNGPTTSGYYGNVVAGPIFKEIADKIHSNRLELQREFPLAESTGPRTPVSHSGHAGDLRTALAALGVPTDTQGEGDWVTTQAGDSIVTMLSRELPGDASGLVPNVMGMGLKDALYILENHGLHVRFSGAGMVRRQSIQPGSRASRGAVIHLELA